jgi:hypothetical protein
MPRFRFFYLLLYEKKSSISMIKAVFFDIDGTLIDTEYGKFQDA